VERVASGRAVWRVIAVVAIALFAALNTLTDVSLPWQPFSDFGLHFDSAATAMDVTRGGAAARAGVRVGDRTDLALTPLASRQYVSALGYYSAPAGRHAIFAFVRDGRTRLVDLVSSPHPRTLADNITDLFQMATYASMIAIGAALVLLRPSTMTWAFFLYSSFANAWSASLGQYLPSWLFVIDQLFFLPTHGVANFALAIFALRFPNDDAPGWRRTAQTAVLWTAAVLLPMSFWRVAATQLAAPGYDLAAEIAGVAAVAMLLFVALVFALTYAHSPAADRAKLRWVILGLVIGESGLVAFEASNALPRLAFAWPLWLVNVVTSLDVVVPITVAYAVIRHRVFDVRFVVGRAVVYGILTTTIVVMVALIDFVAGKALSQTHLAAIGEAAAAIVLGLSLNGLHKRIESVVERVFFRRRRLAEHRLARIAAGLIHAESADAITQAILTEPVHAFSLASGAVFRREGSGRFVRAGAVGWDAPLAVIPADLPAILALSAEPAALPIEESSWPMGLLPGGNASPAYALPVLVQRRLDAIVFYGAHTSAEELDPDELATLTQLLHAAGFAYEHLASETALAQTAALEAENRTLRTLVAGVKV
jgi:hypothetical protein